VRVVVEGAPDLDTLLGRVGGPIVGNGAA
jgi:hypothetical protein